MAFLPESEVERQRRMQQEQGGQGPSVASGASGVITGAGAGQAGQPGQNQGPGSEKRSGSYTNLQKYIDVNRDQAGTLAGNVSNKLSSQAEQAKTQFGDVQKKFNEQVEQASVRRDQNLVNEAVSNPTQFVNQQPKMQQFQKLRDATYKGPKQLQDVDNYSDTVGSLEKANQAIDHTKTEAGRFNTVQQQFAKPTYNRGQQRLDQMLLQNSPEAKQQFESLQQQYGGLMGMLSPAQEQAAQLAQQREQETQAASQDVRQALGQLDDPSTPQNEAAGAFGNFQTDLRSRTQQYKQQQQDLLSRLQRQLGGGDLSTNPRGAAEMDADVLAALGLREGQKLYDVDLSQVQASFNPDAVNEQNVARADDYAKYSALAQLAGTDPYYLTNQQAAGTAPGVQADRDTLNSLIANAQSRYDDHTGKRMQDLINEMNAFSSHRNMINFTPVTPGQVSVDSINRFLAEARAGMGTREGSRSTLQEWDAGLVDSRDRSSQAYAALNNWLKQYNSFNPDRTVTTRK